VSTVTNEVDEIRRQMALIRRDLHEGVREVVATAEAVTDWRRFLGSYPWVFLGAAFAAGYFIVPKRRRVEVKLPEVATQVDVSKVREAVESARQTVLEAAKDQTAGGKRRKNLIGAAFGLLVPVAVRAAQGYAVKYLEHWIAQQQDLLHFGPGPAQTGTPGATGTPPRPGPGPGTGRPSGSGPGARPRPDRGW
jgi:hypothetical protein